MQAVVEVESAGGFLDDAEHVLEVHLSFGGNPSGSVLPYPTLGDFEDEGEVRRRAPLARSAAKHRDRLGQKDVEEHNLVTRLLEAIKQLGCARMLRIALVEPRDQDVRVENDLSHRTGCRSRRRHPRQG